MTKRKGGWESLRADALSSSWSRRTRAGRILAPFAGLPEVDDVLLRLLGDPEDTAVTLETAEALAGVGTWEAVRLLAVGLAKGDDQQGDWILTGLHNVLVDANGLPEVMAACGELVHHPDETVRRGVAEILAWMEEKRG
ncbi:hypothetical protein [Streptomyces sp. ST2-7A]|uniref:hypothetical protein n=1 Tax=Streptomyces sp. ST2-7A TaxID=2907214 RepID=UPI001F3C224F|nr:hypothetical protein [Streptomyces sp. ST2-7A]MCE7082309.1 hypothetical protein [Streptomyces sp. ST2-7A]